MEWDKIWALNKNSVDPIAPRYTAIVSDSAVRLVIDNVEDSIQAKSVPLHPKNEALGTKALICGKTVWIERDDADSIEIGEKVALRNYGKIQVTSKSVDEQGRHELHATIDPEDKDFKKIKVLTWVTADEHTTVEVSIVEFGHLITKPKIEETDDVKLLVNTSSRVEYSAIAEGCMRNLKKGDVIQLERRGFFYVDNSSIGDKKIRLHYIPDGKVNPMSKLNNKVAFSSKGENAAEEKKAANKSELKKLAAAAQAAAGGDQPAANGGAAVAEGEKKGPSKAELKKAAKKEQKKAGKEA